MVTEEWQCHINHGTTHEVHTFTSEEEARAWTESPIMHVWPQGGCGTIRV